MNRIVRIYKKYSISRNRPFEILPICSYNVIEGDVSKKKDKGIKMYLGKGNSFYSVLSDNKGDIV